MATTPRELITARMVREESHHAIATALIDALRPHDGKKFTTRLLAGLSAAVGQAVRYSDHLDIHKLICGEVGLHLGLGKGRPMINIAAIERGNICYLQPAVARNAERAESLAGDWPEEADRLATVLKGAQAAYAAHLAKHTDRFGIAKLHEIEL
jgi:hypothetical protein